MGNWVCIDFGTSNSAAAIVVDGRPKLVSPNNKSYFPTVACVLGKDKIAVCQSAEQFKTKYPEFYLQEFKLNIAEPLDCNGVGYREVIAAILRHIKGCAEIENNGNRIDNVMLTIPAIYTESDRRKDVMRQAAFDAGFQKVTFMREAHAAALHYAYIQGTETVGLSLVYDLGGGTFDPALIMLSGENEPDFLGCDSGVKCGGQYFDAAIYKQAQAEAKVAGAPLDRSSKWSDFWACRLLKEDLSATYEATTLLSNGNPFTLSRPDFEELIRKKLYLTLDACDMMMTSARREWTEVEQILLVGGSTAIPLVSSLLQQHLISHNAPKVKVIRSLNGPNGEYNHNYAVCLGGITLAETKLLHPEPEPEPEPEIGELVNNGKRCRLKLGTNTFGRDRGQDYVFDDPHMSREHFEVIVTKNEGRGFRYKLQTVSTSRATVVNGTLALDRTIPFAPKEIELKDGMTVLAGRTKFQFVEEPK